MANKEIAVEHQEEAERLEQEAEKLERESERVGGRIEETRRDWESKVQDQGTPGAQAEGDAPIVEEDQEDTDDEDKDDE